MNLESTDTQAVFLQRLRRIEGQVRGVQSMVTEGRDCREIMQQMTAIRSAVQSASNYFLQEYATQCLTENAGDDPASRQQVVRDLFVMLERTS